MIVAAVLAGLAAVAWFTADRPPKKKHPCPPYDQPFRRAVHMTALYLGLIEEDE